MVSWDLVMFELWIYERLWIRVKLYQKNPKGWGVEIFFSWKPSTSGWRHENSSRDGQGIPRHPSLVWFCDLETILSEITVG